MIRRLVDMETVVAVIEPSDNGSPYVTFFRLDDDGPKAFCLDCSAEALEKFAYALEAAIAESRNEPRKGVDNGNETR